MSADYGLRCVDCSSDIVPDNMREYAAQIAIKNIHELCELGKACKPLSGEVHVSAYWCDDFRQLAGET